MAFPTPRMEWPEGTVPVRLALMRVYARMTGNPEDENAVLSLDLAGTERFGAAQERFLKALAGGELKALIDRPNEHRREVIPPEFWSRQPEAFMTIVYRHFPAMGRTEWETLSHLTPLLDEAEFMGWRNRSITASEKVAEPKKQPSNSDAKRALKQWASAAETKYGYRLTRRDADDLLKERFPNSPRVFRRDIIEGLISPGPQGRRNSEVECKRFKALDEIRRKFLSVE